MGTKSDVSAPLLLKCIYGRNGISSILATQANKSATHSISELQNQSYENSFGLLENETEARSFIRTPHFYANIAMHWYSAVL